MGKKSKKKTNAAAPRQQNTTNSGGSSTSRAAASTNSTPGVTAAEADDSTIEEIMEPIAELDIKAWEARFPFATKTSDPQAQQLDEAKELFMTGAYLAANTGNLVLAGEYVASAYLRDSRILIILQYRGENYRAYHLLLHDTMMAACREHFKGNNPLSLGILSLANVTAEWPDQTKAYGAMESLNRLLDIPEDVLETSRLGQLGGLSHAKIYFLRGELYKLLLNGNKSALKDWTKALELDPSLAVARRERLRLWSASEMKTHAEIHAECVTFLGLVHEDYSEVDAIYALLAISTFEDARLGTYAEAMEHYRKSLQATSRRVELYGPRAMSVTR